MAIIFANEPLSCLPPDSFSGLTQENQVNRIEFVNTGLTRISPDAFESTNLRSTRLLGLADQQLKELPTNLFDFRFKVDTLDLRGNFFEDIGSGFFNDIRAVKLLDLSGNKGLKRLPSALRELDAYDELNLAFCSNLETIDDRFLNDTRINVLNLVGTLIVNKEREAQFRHRVGLNRRVELIGFN